VLVTEIMTIIVFSASVSGLASAIGAFYAYKMWKSPALLYWGFAWIASFLYGLTFGILLMIHFNQPWLRIIFMSNTLLTVFVLTLLATGLRYSEQGRIPEYTMLYWIGIGIGIPTVFSSSLVIVYYYNGRIKASYTNDLLFYILVLVSFAALLDFSLVIKYLWRKGIYEERNKVYVILFMLGVLSTIIGAISAVASNYLPIPKETRFIFFLFIGPFILPLLIRRPMLLFRAGEAPVFIGISVKNEKMEEETPILELINKNVKDRELEHIELLIKGGIRALLDILQNIVPESEKKLEGEEVITSFELGLWNIVIAKRKTMSALIILEEKSDTYQNALRYLLKRIDDHIGIPDDIDPQALNLYYDEIFDMVSKIFANIDFEQYEQLKLEV